MMKRIWNFICSVFTQDKIAKVWRILFNGIVTAAVQCLTNKVLMDAAYEISLSILGLKATGEEKAAEFNARLYGWCEDHGYSIPTKAELNSIREIAYAAVRTQAERAMALQSGK